MTENTATDEYIYKYKKDESTDDIYNNTILLNQYQSFIIDECPFILGTTDNESIYIEYKQNEKYYKKLISKKKLYEINNKFQAYKNINEIYKLFLLSINNNKITLNNLKKNKTKINISLVMEDNDIFNFSIILKEEKNKNNAFIYKLDKNNKEAALDKDNNKQYLQDSNEGIFMVDFKKKTLNNYKRNYIREFNIDDLENKNNENSNEKTNDNYYENNNVNMNEEEEEEEDEDNHEDYDDDNEQGKNIKKENRTNQLIEVIKNLKNDLLYLKNIVNKNEENNNEEKIKELEIKNNNLIEEITKIKNDLKILFEENKKAKEEINTLKKNNINNNINNIKPQFDIINNSDEEDNSTIKEIIRMTTSNNKLTKTITYDDRKYNLKNNSKKIKKIRKAKSKSQRKSIIFDNRKNNNEIGTLNLFIFKQKYNIKESESELDLTNKKIGDRGLEALSRIQFHKLKSLSLDNNGIFVITPMIHLTLKELEILNLDNNNISDISIFENVNFPSLQILWLNNNNISDISVFEKVKFNQLQHLWLNNNNITDISVFKNTDLNKLERIYLKSNKIEDISCLEEMEINKLQLIYLNKNRIDSNLSRNKEIIKNLKKKIKYFSY